MSNREHFKELLTFSKQEKNGIIVLVFIIVSLSIANELITRQKPETADFSKFEAEIAEFEASLVPKEEKEYLSKLDKFIIARYDSLELFKFNPNTTTKNEWLQLGLTEKQIKTVLNYTSKGGKFYDREDFRKIYGIRTRQFEILQPYIDLPENSGYQRKSKYNNRNYKENYRDYYKEKYNNENKKDTLFIFDPNICEKSELLALGFNGKETAIILKYRNKGGVFYKPSDLKKIYALRISQYERVKNYIKIGSKTKTEFEEYPEINQEYENKPVKNIKVDINALSEQEFIELGGFWKYNARRIILQREKLGAYINKEQLLDIPDMNKEIFDKIKYQITVSKIVFHKININLADKKELIRNPYLGQYNVYKIIRYRAKNGKFEKLDELVSKKVLPQEVYEKVKSYLTI